MSSSISPHQSHNRSHRRKHETEVSCCLKYLIFGSNVIFWLFGLSTLLIGLWAWTEKDIFNNLSRITNIALDPAFVLIVIGCVAFIIGFTGCVGALRGNPNISCHKYHVLIIIFYYHRKYLSSRRCKCS
jgi:hypothetical protein